MVFSRLNSKYSYLHNIIFSKLRAEFCIKASNSLLHLFYLHNFHKYLHNKYLYLHKNNKTYII